MEFNGAGIVVFRIVKPMVPEFLVVKAKWGKHWSFPKGHMDKKDNGSTFKCALRETGEETGVTQDDIQLIGNFKHTVRYKLDKATKKCPDGVKTVLMYLGKVRSNTKIDLSAEHIAYKWVSQSVAKALLRDDFGELIDSAIESVIAFEEMIE